ncbi:hypothetical protein AC249_AIPGENE25344 [Exaiptasia diaphana]|nr:hypothetical protein AC249_AIPGENE25344 [Exaiptasia diaphana]
MSCNMAKYLLFDNLSQLPHDAIVPSQVFLTAKKGKADSLIDEIKSIADVGSFEDPKIDKFCENYGVKSEKEKKALQNLLNVRSPRSLKLREADANNQEVETKEFTLDPR